MGGNYNGKLRSAEYLKKDPQQKSKKRCSCPMHDCCNKVDDNIIEIRRAETYADLFASVKW